MKKKRRKKTSLLPTRIYRYSAPTSRKHDVEGRELIEDEIERLRLYRNQLVEIERERRARYRAAVLQYPSVAELQNQCNALTEEIEQLVEEAKAERKAKRARVKSNPRTQRIKDLKAERKAVREQLKLERAKFSGAPEVLATNDYGFTASKQAYNAETAPRAWGTRLRANDDARRSFKTSKDDPRFLHRDRTGEIAVQIQTAKGGLYGKLNTEGLLACQDTRARLEHCSGKHYRLHLRVDSEARQPVWCSWPVLLHRPLPPGANIKWVVAQRHKTPHLGTLGHPDCGLSWQILFYLEHESFNVPKRLEGPVAALNLGFRKLDDAGSLRVAFVVGTDCHQEEIVLEGHGPREDDRGNRFRYPGGHERRGRAGIRNSLAYADTKRQARDLRFNAARDLLVQHREAAPEWLREWTKTLYKWRAPAKLQKLRRYWISHRYEGDHQIFEAIDNWGRRDRHDMQHEQGNRTRAYTRRDQLYGRKARELCLRYRILYVPKLDLRKMRTKRRADEAGESELEQVQRQQLNDAALYLLIAKLRMMASNTGATIVELDAALTTQIHHTCGHRDESNRVQSVWVRCTHCNREYDQDESAARNLLAKATADASATGGASATASAQVNG